MGFGGGQVRIEWRDPLYEFMRMMESHIYILNTILDLNQPSNVARQLGDVVFMGCR